MQNEATNAIVVCPGCNAELKINADLSSRKVQCPKCTMIFRVASGPPIPQPKPPPPPTKPVATAPLPFNPTLSRPKPTKSELITVPQSTLDAIRQAPTSPVTLVQVNVNSGGMASSLGVTSLILGIFSFLICWLPGLGLAFSGLGLTLGLCGLFAADQQNNSGFGYSIAGTAISGVGTFFGLYLIFVYIKALN